MKKSLRKCLLLAAMLAPLCGASAQETPFEGTNFVKMAADESDFAGRCFFTGYTTSSKKYYFLNALSESGYYTATEFTPTGGRVTEEPEGAILFNIENVDGKYAFKNTTSKKYIKNAGNNTYAITEVDAAGEAGTLATISTDGKVETITFDCGEGNNNNLLKLNGSANPKRFSSYASGQTAVQLYRQVYTREGLTAGNFGTMCLPFGGKVSGAELYAIEAKQMDGEEVKSISLVKVEKAVAGQPYIFKATGTELVVKYEGDAEVTPPSEGVNGLVGSLEAKNVDEGMYLISGNQVKKVGSAGGHIKANRCYINMANVPNAPASAGAFIFSFGNGTDAIQAIKAGNSGTNAIYDLSGRRVKAAKKGLYIVNGKKIIK